jgi:hypothetical protein
MTTNQSTTKNWIESFITYNAETHLFTAWDETQANELGTYKSWDEACDVVIDYAKTLNEHGSSWKHIGTAPNNTFVLIKGLSGMMKEKEYVIKAEFDTHRHRWMTVQHDDVSDEFTAEPTHWMEVPE